MKLPSVDQFKVNPCEIGEDDCLLITPKDMATMWDDTNARFRSCIIRKADGKVISQGFRKFCNFFERPTFQPWDNNWPVTCRYKYDGSLIMLSAYKSNPIIRTRGTSNILNQDTGVEVVDLIHNKYGKILESFYYKSEQYTILMEHTSPSRIIVLREHDEPTLTLLGIIRNSDARLLSQFACDELAKDWDIGRPKEYKYSSISECIADVEAWVSKEGVVLYSPCGNILKKVKATQYLEAHKLATGITGVSQVLDLFMASPKFIDSDDFFKFIETTINYEIADKCRPYIAQICNSYVEIIRDMSNIDEFVEQLIQKGLDRKCQALEIQSKLNGWQLSYAFSRLGNKMIDEKVIKAAIERQL